MFNTPILFLIFNRPDKTRRVFEQIRAARPAKLFIAADGPRPYVPDDVEKCKSTRAVVMDKIDWDCEVKTLFRDENLGCDRAPSEAITWFFENIEAGIILEDDCLPSTSFFTYCSTLLHRYKDEERVMMISGFNPLGTWFEKEVDYFYTEGSIWGWATWRRAWKYFDIRMRRYQNADYKHYLSAVIDTEYPGATAAYDLIISGNLDAWDYQWHFARKANNGLSITPSRNLIENIGFGNDATHTRWELNPYNGVRSSDELLGLRLNDLFIMDNLYKAKVKEFENSVGKVSLGRRMFNSLRERSRKIFNR